MAASFLSGLWPLICCLCLHSTGWDSTSLNCPNLATIGEVGVLRVLPGEPIWKVASEWTDLASSLCHGNNSITSQREGRLMDKNSNKASLLSFTDKARTLDFSHLPMVIISQIFSSHSACVYSRNVSGDVQLFDWHAQLSWRHVSPPDTSLKWEINRWQTAGLWRGKKRKLQIFSTWKHERDTLLRRRSKEIKTANGPIQLYSPFSQITNLSECFTIWTHRHPCPKTSHPIRKTPKQPFNQEKTKSVPDYFSEHSENEAEDQRV